MVRGLWWPCSARPRRTSSPGLAKTLTTSVGVGLWTTATTTPESQHPRTPHPITSLITLDSAPVIPALVPCQGPANPRLQRTRTLARVFSLGLVFLHASTKKMVKQNPARRCCHANQNDFLLVLLTLRSLQLRLASPAPPDRLAGLKEERNARLSATSCDPHIIIPLLVPHSTQHWQGGRLPACHRISTSCHLVCLWAIFPQIELVARCSAPPVPGLPAGPSLQSTPRS